jgi:hypothetical protein
VENKERKTDLAASRLMPSSSRFIPCSSPSLVALLVWHFSWLNGIFCRVGQNFPGYDFGSIFLG